MSKFYGAAVAATIANMSPPQPVAIAWTGYYPNHRNSSTPEGSTTTRIGTSHGECGRFLTTFLSRKDYEGWLEDWGRHFFDLECQGCGGGAPAEVILMVKEVS